MDILSIALALLFPPCPTEDSNMCMWSASSQGDGTGTSFVAISDDLVIYLP